MLHLLPVSRYSGDVLETALYCIAAGVLDTGMCAVREQQNSARGWLGAVRFE